MSKDLVVQSPEDRARIEQANEALGRLGAIEVRKGTEIDVPRPIGDLLRQAALSIGAGQAAVSNKDVSMMEKAARGRASAVVAVLLEWHKLGYKAGGDRQSEDAKALLQGCNNAFSQENQQADQFVRDEYGVTLPTLSKWRKEVKWVDEKGMPHPTYDEAHYAKRLFTSWFKAAFPKLAGQTDAEHDAAADAAWTAAQMQPYLLRLGLEETGVHVIAATKHYERCGGELVTLGIARGEVAPPAPRPASTPLLREATQTIVRLEAELVAQHANHQREIAALKAQIAEPVVNMIPLRTKPAPDMCTCSAYLLPHKLTPKCTRPQEVF